MFGDVGQPQPVRRRGGEVPPAPIVVDGRARLGVLAAAFAFPEHAPPAVVAADSPSGPLGHHLASGPGLVNEEAVAELGIVAVGLEHGVGPVGIGQFRVGDR
ncbi:hypothetical protein [Streptomyces diastaticus]|uniref:hypothetical protein n=1 Tax=Streptomyces diastaticus TaxID=1956 RepID=UPI003D163DB3